MADRTTSSISIAAPPAAIMAVVADLERYPEWSTGVRDVEVLQVASGGERRPSQARFTIDQSGIRDSYVLDYEWLGDREVRWTLNSGGVVKAMDGSYVLADNGDGTTSVEYALAVDLTIPMLGLMKRKAEKVIVDTALKGLKKRVEG